MIIPAIQLLVYADPATGALEQTRQADALIEALRVCQHNFIELDFLGVEAVSTEFCDQFIRLAAVELAEVWLTPRNYAPTSRRLVNPLLERLQQQREQAWITACEALVNRS